LCIFCILNMNFKEPFFNWCLNKFWVLSILKIFKVFRVNSSLKHISGTLFLFWGFHFLQLHLIRCETHVTKTSSTLESKTFSNEIMPRYLACYYISLYTLSHKLCVAQWRYLLDIKAVFWYYFVSTMQF